MRLILTLVAFCVMVLSASISFAPHAIPLGLSVVGLSGCLEDSCDKVRDDCSSRGLVATNCKEDKSPVSDKCQCDCVSPSN